MYDIVIINEVGAKNSLDLSIADLEKAKELARKLYEASGNTVSVIEADYPFDMDVYTVMSPKNKFLRLTSKEQEDKLMETAMRIMDIFCDMVYTQKLNPDKLDNMSFLQKLELFTGWARDYEYTYYDEDVYNDFWLEETERVFENRLKEEFGNAECPLACEN